MEVGLNLFSITRIENAYSIALKKQEQKEWSWPVAATRAAQAGDPKMLMALERCASAMDAWQDEQKSDLERKRRELGHERMEFTEAQMFREAYVMADKGKVDTMEHFTWIYGAVGLLCGYSRQ
jgi:putative protein kinase ArgK-like GTPase of G3E family